MSSKHLYTRNLTSDLLISYCKDRGVDIRPILQELNIDLQPGPGLRYTSFNAMCELFEILSKELEDPYFGINWAKAQPDDFRYFGPVIYLASRVATWRDFIDFALNILQSFGNGFDFKVVEDIEANHMHLECSVNPLARPCRQYLQHHFAAVAQIGIRVMPDVRLEYVSFEHSGNPKDVIYEDAFRGPLMFEAPKNSMVVDVKYLERKTSSSSGLIGRGLKSFLNYQIKRGSTQQNSISVEVASLIPELLGVRNISQPQIATLLGVSPKKLQRLLAAEGTSFSNIYDACRKSMAVRILSETEMTLNEIAVQLDYSSQETFIQAFHRWFAQTPSEFKSKLDWQSTLKHEDK